ncbi:hypothetical protein P692DRAFT_201873415 [Suillus brevipes Sb2]|nr:hypothetical protein P692DRAFT_201873415 [Suillus brevipes Sb2]
MKEVREFGNARSARRESLQCLQHLEFFDQDNLAEAFGFLDPDSIIRRVHIIPAFAYSRTDTLLGPSFVRKEEENDTDWRYYYLNMFVDRDTFMRFRGGGIGHKAMWDWDEFLQGEGCKTQSIAQEDSRRGDELDLEDEGEIEDLEEQDEEDTDEEDDEEGDEDDDDDDEDDDDSDEDDDEDDEDEDDEDDEDRVLADEGEELDDDLLAEEGYGAL